VERTIRNKRVFRLMPHSQVVASLLIVSQHIVEGLSEVCVAVARYEDTYIVVVTPYM
jgi:hypothetical protein